MENVRSSEKRWWFRDKLMIRGLVNEQFVDEECDTPGTPRLPQHRHESTVKTPLAGIQLLCGLSHVDSMRSADGHQMDLMAAPYEAPPVCS